MASYIHRSFPKLVQVLIDLMEHGDLPMKLSPYDVCQVRDLVAKTKLLLKSEPTGALTN